MVRNRWTEVNDNNNEDDGALTLRPQSLNNAINIRDVVLYSFPCRRVAFGAGGGVPHHPGPGPLAPSVLLDH